jgi:putative DNA primase/helicase
VKRTPQDAPGAIVKPVEADSDTDLSVVQQLYDVDSWKRLLQFNAKNLPLATLLNISLILSNDPRWSGVLAYDDFSMKVITRKPSPLDQAVVGDWTDVQDSRTTAWLSQFYQLNAPTKLVREAIMMAANSKSFHPVQEYLASLEWDGEERLDTWTIVYLGATPSDYVKLAGAKWLIAGVARVMRPGCKVDNVLIIEGDQGSLKSTALAIFGGPWFMDTPFVIGERDAYMQIRGAWVVELAELDGFSRSESSRAKAFFSSNQDVYRAPYAAWVQTIKRQCVFAGSVNHGAYLRDTTGNRRYWPILAGAIDIESLRRDRDQLWAEAAVRYADGTPWWVSEDEVALFAIEQEAREVTDAYEDAIADYLIGKSEVMMADILKGALGLAQRDWSLALQTRVGESLARLGWKPGKRAARTVDSRRPRIYVRSPVAQEDE